MGFLTGVVLAMSLQAGPVEMTAGPVFNPALCAKKRVDPCGCHHVYGIRHCHQSRKSNHCEAQVRAYEPEETHDAEDASSPLQSLIDPKKSVSM
ncbi:hypothetical protein D7Y13_33060 [Corallococcus praedator]|uniref:Uncharacterized protein n=1 Tax=Corallococcus praedator TaxID=2316724 RepID=A0ABX9Q850_9BACT|nr:MULTISPECIES: hypothetical protein [Corallococcus]RKH15860.1 hypothetical protein D7X74_17135 [Corallococcus sp. CA047B]RKH25063.1 hypothetical protein D7X75_30735 [Corallococcus sp. CA031C]RKH94555.1 hypothetical protein D7Y13_33060 [Corallococcus praedator]